MSERQCEKVLAALPAEPMRIREIGRLAGVPTRSTQAWVSCFAVLGRAQRHEVGRKRPLWSAVSLPPKPTWFIMLSGLPAAFTRKQAEAVGLHSMLFRAAELVGLLERTGSVHRGGRPADLWRAA